LKGFINRKIITKHAVYSKHISTISILKRQIIFHVSVNPPSAHIELPIATFLVSQVGKIDLKLAFRACEVLPR